MRAPSTRTCLITLAAVALAAPIGAALLLRQGPSSSAASEAPAAVVPADENSFVLGGEAGSYAVGIAARPASAGIAVRATVLAPSGEPAEGVAVRLSLSATRGTTALTGRDCGPGCFEASLPARGQPRRVTVSLVRGPGTPAAAVLPLPANWPPKPAAALLARATRAFSALRALTAEDSLRSDARHGLQTRWQFVAPDRMTYSIAGGSQAVVIGGNRWDRDPGSGWQRSTENPPLQVPIAPWSSLASDASLIATERRQGKLVDIVSFVDHGPIPAWFTIAIDSKTGRTLEVHMTSAAHFMHEVYSGFDAPARIVPPR